ncbi:MAG: phosphate/phosphite/phosphonate ABC transporter substrate-binding protein [Deltaproteobacteria bacterium]|nr:phosphate/phosphite/phosphonate ABC transporter substrate-binding protein [Deltaproteobacteria bacterium]
MHIRNNILMLGFVLLSLILFPTNGISAQEKIERPLVLGVHPYLPATDLIKRFTPLAKEIESKVKRPVRISIAKDYKEHIRRIGRDDLDIAYMGPISYVEMVNRFGTKPLLSRHELNGRPTFQGCIFVGKDSDIKSMKDLKRKKFVFGSLESTMSYIVPYYMLINEGVRLDDLREHAFLGSHNNVALSVLIGDFDAGAVKEEVFNLYEKRGLKLLARSPAISEHIFVASNKLDAALVDEIRKALQGIKGEKKVRSILSPLKKGTTGLIPVQDRDYDNLRVILKAVSGDKGGKKILF